MEKLCGNFARDNSCRTKQNTQQRSTG